MSMDGPVDVYGNEMSVVHVQVYAFHVPTMEKISVPEYDFWAPNDFRSCLIYERLRCEASNSYPNLTES